MKKDIKKAYIVAGSTILVATIGLISEVIQRSNNKQDYIIPPIEPINLVDTNIETGDESPVIISGSTTFIYETPVEKENGDNHNPTRQTASKTNEPIIESAASDESEKVKISEIHTPNDSVTNVSVTSWDPNLDIGIDNNMYDGGLKVVMSNMFTSMGSGVDNNIISKITIPLSDSLKNKEEKIFSGTFVLDQSMFGSKTKGTITIMINNQEVFSTGEIDGNTKEAFPFAVSYEDADTIIIETNATLKGSNFVYGIVNSKE